MNQSPFAFEIVMESAFLKQNSSFYRKNASHDGFCSESFENFDKDIASKKKYITFQKIWYQIENESFESFQKNKHQEIFQARKFREIYCLSLQKEAFKLFQEISTKNIFVCEISCKRRI